MSAVKSALQVWNELEYCKIAFLNFSLEFQHYMRNEINPQNFRVYFHPRANWLRNQCGF
ncbi:hypothetical protein CDL12_20456 [Handroanthus impetiginosus]|uniref:Uncharacterized protein n=1 Tax=Handroanthus impetiginosus TaxID=429701 RepID=A0A2G9GNV9_9LAMI|nr:hypothetical protein CDL12_20456 [Handroanthus impetiginosus]